MKIEFENGNKITTIDDTEEAARSKRYAEFITYNRKHPYDFSFHNSIKTLFHPLKFFNIEFNFSSKCFP